MLERGGLWQGNKPLKPHRHIELGPLASFKKFRTVVLWTESVLRNEEVIEDVFGKLM